MLLQHKVMARFGAGVNKVQAHLLEVFVFFLILMIYPNDCGIGHAAVLHITEPSRRRLHRFEYGYRISLSSISVLIVIRYAIMTLNIGLGLVQGYTMCKSSVMKFLSLVRSSSNKYGHRPWMFLTLLSFFMRCLHRFDFVKDFTHIVY